MKDDVLKDVPSLTWRNVVGEVFNNPRAPLSNMDDVDLPAYDLVDIERYYNIRNSFDYQSSRGCPFKCSFCYNEMFNDSKWRCKSGEKVVEEMTYLHRKYGVRNFATVDDEFFIKRSRTRIIVDGLIKNGGGFKWSGFCRFDTFAGFDDELVRDLPKAGVEQMFFGAESGNAKTLELIKKKITVDQVISAMERTQKYNIHPVVSFIVGFPHEEEESIEATLALCDRIKSINPNAEIGGLLSYTPYPGAGLFNTAVDNGFEAPKSLEEWGLWRFNDRMEHPWLSPAMRQKLRTISIISRFRFFSEEFFRRTRGRGILRMAFWVANSPFRLSSAVRWKYRCWRYPFEWNLWAWLVRRAFGFF